jgi:2-C-methyl-D-erythritol 4-phosphate cytidylyltransferase
VIAAAGSGQRLGAGGPKAFVELAGRPLLEWTLEALQGAASIAEVIVAAPPGSESRVSELGVLAVAGGEHRSQSVAKALELAGEELIVVHDAARPLVTPGLVDAVVEELAAEEGAAGVIAAARVTDTIKEASGEGRVERTLDRSRLWAVQTPQAFHRVALERALEVPADVLARATDDAWLVERAGGRVRVVESGPTNLKVTTPHDLRLAEMLLGERA